MQIRRTLTANNPPTGLQEGQLAVGLADQPPVAWAGVPTSIDPSGRIPITGLVRTVAGAPQPAGAVGQLWWDEDGAQLYVYTGAQWVVANNPPIPDLSAFMRLSGGTMTGPLILADGSTAGVSRPPTVQRYTAGTGTYTPPAGTAWIRVRIVGGGGGGGGGGNGLAGGTTSFGGWTAMGGGGGLVASGAVGGTFGNPGSGGATGAGVLIDRLAGGYGQTGISNAVAGYVVSGPAPGGTSAWGSNASSGGGGTGGIALTAATGTPGSGGGGEYVEFVVDSPGPLSYAVGGFGAGAAAAGFSTAGSNGVAGVIVVEAYA